jgi:hypothetical protein
MWWHLKGFSDVRASFLPGIFTFIKKRCAPKKITAFWEANI